MTQFTIGNQDPSSVSGTQLMDSILEPFEVALHSNHKGPTVPAYVAEGMHWIDDSAEPWLLKYYDGSNNLTLASINPTTHQLNLYHQGTVLGTAALANTGAGASQVPLNSDLGTASKVNTGTSSDQVPLNSSLGAAAYLGLGEGLENSTGIRVKLDGGTLSRSAAGVKVADDAIDLNNLVHQTADTLLGMDETGIPSVITAGANVTIDSGVISSSAGGLTDVSQGDLNTSTGSVAVSAPNTSSGYANGSGVVLPGGEYGFSPTMNSWSVGGSGSPKGGVVGFGGGTGNRIVALAGSGNGNSANLSANLSQRYVTASAPWDYGDGDAYGFIYAQIEKGSGKIVSLYCAFDPPWGYNGPTKVFPDYINLKTGKKFKRIEHMTPVEDILAGRKTAEPVVSFKTRLEQKVAEKWPKEAAKLENLQHLAAQAENAKPKSKEKAMKALQQEKIRHISVKEGLMETEKDVLLTSEFEEITQETKNADLDILPGPFDALPGHITVLLDPMDERVRSLLIEQEKGLDLLTLIQDGVVYADNEELSRRKGPNSIQHGVMQAALKYK